MKPKEIDVCPLFDSSDIPYCICMATDRGCSIELAVIYKQCYKYKQMKEVMSEDV